MREKVKDIDRLYHIREAISDINEFMSEKTFNDLQTNKLLLFGVVKCIEIIGEAAYMLSLDFKDSHKELPWQAIIDMRHVLVHGYYTTKPIFIWDTYQNDLEPLSKQIEIYITELEKELNL